MMPHIKPVAVVSSVWPVGGHPAWRLADTCRPSRLGPRWQRASMGCQERLASFRWPTVIASPGQVLRDPRPAPLTAGS
jgi:hypothetical protein